MADTKFVRGADKLLTRIATIQASLQLPKLTGDIGSLLLRRTLDRFDREVDPDGNPWAPLKEDTIKRKLRRGDASGKLKKTLDLRNSIKAVRGGAGSFAVNTGAGVRIGIQDPRVAKYGRYQNTGTKTIPARRFLGIGRLDVKAVDSLMRRKAKQIEEL